MTRSEWVHVVRQIAAFWPSAPYPDRTIEAGYSLCGELPTDAVERAICELASEGREFAPPPGVVFARAEAIDRMQRPALPPPDTLRDLTPEERERAERWRAQLRAATERLTAR